MDLSLGASASGITGAGHLDNLGTGSSTSFSVTVPASLTPGTYPVDVVATHAGGTEVVNRLTGPVDLSLGASASGITGAGHLDNLGTGSSTSF
ncbi:hypothetical protein CTI14_62160, partial [Methylobacterium radiotolerans]